MSRQRLRLISGCVIVLCGCGLLLARGCEPAAPQREMATVSGKVTLNGEPLNAGRVIFAHVEGPGAAADIQPDGTYSVEAAVGQTEVAIDHRSEPEQGARDSAEAMLGKSLVPEPYTSAQTSGLSLNVQPGKNEFNIEMKE